MLLKELRQGQTWGEAKTSWKGKGMERVSRGSPPAVLIAEPVGSIMEELGEFLEGLGCDTIRVSTLKDVLLTLQNQGVDLLILDASLLEEDCDLISVIKGMAPDVPVILCAERNTPEFERRVRQQRVFFYHIKSFGSQDLKMAVSNAINKSFH